MAHIIEKTVKDEYGTYGPYYVLRNGQGECKEVLGKGAQVTQQDIVKACSKHNIQLSESYIDKVKDDRRFGLASDRDFLKNAFDESTDITPLRDKGIEEGMTKADEMKFLEFEDGSEAYAARPEDALEGFSLFDTEEKFINNNLYAPDIINALGGHGCRSVLTEDENGDEYIVKEGIKGTRSAYADGRRRREMEDDSIIRTIAAGYFVGNTDLLQKNLHIGEDDEMYIIDHDASTFSASEADGDVQEIGGFFRFIRENGEDLDDFEEHVYNKAFDIIYGDIEIPHEGTEQHKYVYQSAEYAVGQAICEDLDKIDDSVYEKSYNIKYGDEDLPFDDKNKKGEANLTAGNVLKKGRSDDFDRFVDTVGVDKTYEMIDEISDKDDLSEDSAELAAKNIAALNNKEESQENLNRLEKLKDKHPNNKVINNAFDAVNLPLNDLDEDDTIIVDNTPAKYIGHTNDGLDVVLEFETLEKSEDYGMVKFSYEDGEYTDTSSNEVVYISKP